jgi:hypothetical protein
MGQQVEENTWDRPNHNCPGTSATLCRNKPPNDPKDQVNDLVVLFLSGE